MNSALKIEIIKGNSILSQWNQDSNVDLPFKVTLLKELKESVNKYLTDYIDKNNEKVELSTTNNKTSVEDIVEEENDSEDSLSKLIQEVKSNHSSKKVLKNNLKNQRKNSNSTPVKRLKK